MKTEKSCGLIVYKRPLRFLLIKHSKMGHWDFPKGWIEKGETEQQTALREAREEAGLKNLKIIPGFKYEYDYFYQSDTNKVFKKVTFFLAEAPGNAKVKTSWEHSEFKWAHPKQAIELVSFKDAKQLLKEAWNFLKI